MKLMISLTQLEECRSRELVPMQCGHCPTIFHRPKNQIQAVLAGAVKHKYDHCCRRCKSLSTGEIVICSCAQCGSTFDKVLSQVKRAANSFCSSSCAGTYGAAHKKTGTRRAKLEVWLEEQLSVRYPTLDVSYNKADAIEAELDIYIPSLKLAFELNGIFHYEPIFGSDKLSKIQRRDQNKFAQCHERDIGLCVIDTSKIKYHKPKTAQPVLDIITRIIDDKIGPSPPIRTETNSASKAA